MVLETHPFLKSFASTGFYNSLPPQMIPYKDKIKGINKRGISYWMEQCMDTFEYIAKIQYEDNLKLLVNERLLNGEFITEDYIEDALEEFSDSVLEMSKDAELPKFIKHYDMISTIINTQVEEFNKLPDIFNITGHGEEVENDNLRIKKDLINNWVNEELKIQFDTFLELEGVDVNQKFESEEEKQKFLEQLELMRKERTPEQIGSLLKNDYRHFAELWAEFELEDQKDRFNITKLRRREFKDFLAVGKRFRYIGASERGLSIESKNWKNIFFHKSPDVSYVQNGDYVGEIYVASSSFIIDKFREYLTEEEIRSFEHNNNLKYKEHKKTKDLFGNDVNYTSVDGLPYNEWMPSYSATLNRLAPNLGMNWISNSIDIAGGFNSGINNMFVVVEAYWRSYKKVGRLAWINPESLLFEVIKVDESFVVPSTIKVLKDADFNSEPIENTIVWTWEEEIWEGVKIDTYSQTNTGSLYLKIRPSLYQGASKFKMYNKKLPIVGQIANDLNTKGGGQLELWKPYQFMYNIAMNKAVKYMETTKSAFAAMDVAIIPNQKDYGGENNLVDWIEDGTDTGIAAVDTSPSNTLGGQSGGQFPRVIDIDNTAKVVQHLNIASNIRMMALSSLGFSPQRLGDVAGIDTATGINTSMAKSFNATGSWFTDFWEAEREILQQQLDVAQWLQTTKMDFSAILSKGITTEAFLNVNNNEFDLYDLRVYVTDSQEELRQQEVFKTLAIQNNTTGANMSTLMTMSSSNSSRAILKMVKEEEDRAMQIQQQIRELEQQEKAAATEFERQKLKIQQEQFTAKLENDLEEAWIRSRTFLDGNEQDLDTSGIPDAFEYEKFTAKSNSDINKLSLQEQKLTLEKEKQKESIKNRNQEFNLKLQELELKRQQMLQTAKNVKYLDKGKYKA